MKLKVILSLLICLLFLSGMAMAEIRTYRQFKDVVTQENGRVLHSEKLENLFECTYKIDRDNKTITRVKIRRLDDAAGRENTVIYDIKQQELDLVGSEAGNGGKVLVAVRRDGGEILELGRNFAFTMRTSPFSMVITGVYRRVFSGKKDPHHHDSGNN
jgi:hypothetical protein